MPGLVPKESLNAHFQMILPLKWKDEKYKPLCVHLAGTGDHVSTRLNHFSFDSFLFDSEYGFSSSGEEGIFWRSRCFEKETSALFCWRIRFMGCENRSSRRKRSHRSLERTYIIVEFPFRRSNLNNVSDIIVMGGCLILESLVLFHFCERNGLGPLGISGLSMGGHVSIRDSLQDWLVTDSVPPYRWHLSLRRRGRSRWSWCLVCHGRRPPQCSPKAS